LFGTKEVEEEEKKKNRIEQQQQDKKNYTHQTISRRIKQRDYPRQKNIEEENKNESNR
jgi:hypothetical protein